MRSCSASACGLVAFVTGMWTKGTPKDRTSAARSGWLEITSPMSTRSSARRQRHNRSSRQWSYRETMIATRLGTPACVMFHLSMPSRSATSSANAVRRSSTTMSRLAAWETIRRKNSPPTGSVVVWSDSTMLAWCPARNVLIAAMMPGPSAHCTIRRPMFAASWSLGRVVGARVLWGIGVLLSVRRSKSGGRSRQGEEDQAQVECDDHGHDRGNDRGEAGVDVPPHDGSSSGEPHKRGQGEGKAEGEDDLGEHEGTHRVSDQDEHCQ